MLSSASSSHFPPSLFQSQRHISQFLRDLKSTKESVSGEPLGEGLRDSPQLCPQENKARCCWGLGSGRGRVRSKSSLHSCHWLVRVPGEHTRGIWDHGGQRGSARFPPVCGKPAPASAIPGNTPPRTQQDLAFTLRGWSRLMTASSMFLPPDCTTWGTGERRASDSLACLRTTQLLKRVPVPPPASCRQTLTQQAPSPTASPPTSPSASGSSLQHLQGLKALRLPASAPSPPDFSSCSSWSL